MRDWYINMQEGTGLNAAANIAVFFVVAAIVIAVVWLIARAKRASKDWPVEAVPAVVVKMEEAVSGNGMAGRMSRNAPMGMSYARNYVTFQMDNGDVLNFLIGGADDARLRINMKGTLCYQGE